MTARVADVVRGLARNAEAVCRQYLSNGRREGRYWTVGDVANTRGRSLYVRLDGPDCGKGAAGKWTDAATGQHGDLLDLIGLSCGLDRFGDRIREARSFLSGRRFEPTTPAPAQSPRSGPERAQRLFASARPIAGTLAERYLESRGLSGLTPFTSLRFHPRCFHRRPGSPAPDTWPALIAAVTDLEGRITGVQRTWLDPAGAGKASLAHPRRAIGDLLGNAVRFGRAGDALVAGEGIETVLSVRAALPWLPAVAALSGSHLGAILFPHSLLRLYVARDRGPAGERAAARLVARAAQAGLEAVAFLPELGDFNEDLQRSGVPVLRRSLLPQLAPVDAAGAFGAEAAGGNAALLHRPVHVSAPVEGGRAAAF